MQACNALRFSAVPAFCETNGKKKALVAVGHSILVIAYHVLTNKCTYQELGGDYFDKRYAEKRRSRLIKQLQSLGLKVTVEELPHAA